MDRGPEIPPEIGSIIGTAALGFWAFLGAIMRGAADWTDPVTKKFSPRLFLVALSTALIMGQIAAWLGDTMHWEPRATIVAASTLGYLTPAVVMAWVRSWMKIGDPDAGRSA